MIRDTTPEAQAVRTEILRRKGLEWRCTEVARMSAVARRLARDGIRMRHPGYDDDQVKWALFRLLVGPELFARAWPHAPIVAP